MGTTLILGIPYIAIETDQSCTLNNEVRAVHATGTGITVQLPRDPVDDQTHRIVAVTGDVTVTGNGHLIIGSATVSGGTSEEYTFARKRGWIPEGATADGAATGRIGLKEFTIPDGNTSFAVTPTMLHNASHPGSDYQTLRFLGGNTDVNPRIILPSPADQDSAYQITIENRSLGGLEVANDPATGDTFLLFSIEGGGDEVSLEAEIDSRSSGGTNAWTYRTTTLVTTEGAYRVPGFREPT